MESKTCKIVIVEDNDVVRDGFSLLISSLSEHEVVAAYETCEEAIKNLEKDNPDLVLMDIELPGMASDVILVKMIGIKYAHSLCQRISGFRSKEETGLAIDNSLQRTAAAIGDHRAPGGLHFHRRNTKIFLTGKNQRLTFGKMVMHDIIRLAA